MTVHLYIWLCRGITASRCKHFC